MDESSGLVPDERELEEEELEEEEEEGEEGTLKREKFEKVLEGMNRSPKMVREGEEWWLELIRRSIWRDGVVGSKEREWRAIFEGEGSTSEAGRGIGRSSSIM